MTTLTSASTGTLIDDTRGTTLPRVRRRAALSSLVGVPVAGTALLAGCGSPAQADGLTAEGLPRYAYRAEPALASYRFAVAQPDLLAKLPCYCGCAKLQGFENLRDCFISASREFNAHGANCATCTDEALDAKKLQSEGRPVAEIRRTIDATYMGRGTPTNTPPVE